MRRKRAPRVQELMNAYDNNMNEIGVYARSYIHYHKMWHKVVQCWIVGRTEAGIRVYLQRRSFEKMSHPGRYDVTAGGHVSAGELPEDAVLRETQEEIGLRLDTDRLQSLGYVKEVAGNDREIAYLYVYEEANPPFRPGKEVIYMVSADIDDFYAMMKGERESIVVVPAIKTGPMHEEAFSVTMENCCMHQNFLDVVYPYIKETMGSSKKTEQDGTQREYGRVRDAGLDVRCRADKRNDRLTGSGKHGVCR